MLNILLHDWPSCKGGRCLTLALSLYGQIKACNDSCACFDVHVHMGGYMRVFKWPAGAVLHTHAFLCKAKSSLATKAAYRFGQSTGLCMLKDAAGA